MVSKEKFGCTHFLRIPYATAISRPQLHASLDQIARDAMAAALPRETWLHPEQLHYTMGHLRLDTPKRIEEACQLLHDISQEYRNNTATYYKTKYLNKNPNIQHSRRSPFIALHGLHEQPSQPDYPKAAMSLQCNVKESFRFLQGFCAPVMNVFIAKGFIPALQPKADLLQSCLMRTSNAKSNVPLSKEAAARALGRKYLSPVFDASDLHRKYKDFPWTSEFPLERMCISEYVLRDVWKGPNFVRTAYRDIASVPLPGVSPTRLAPDDPDEYFVRRKYDQTPRVPRFIPSMPANR